MDPVYLDHNSTTPVHPLVIEAMLPYLTTHWGNPGCRHVYGQRAREAFEVARAQVAALIGAQADEITFTSGGTESNNLALYGVQRPDRTHYVTSAVEHGATLGPLRVLESRGATLDILPVDGDGRTLLPEALPAHTNLLSLMLAQNEVGTLQPVAEAARLAHAVGAVCHSDAAQAVGKIGVDVDDLGVDLLSIAGHKLYAPKGIGALFIRRGVELRPLHLGAGQQGGLRPGTLDVPGAVALGAAAELAQAHLDEEHARLVGLKEALWQGLNTLIPGLRRHGGSRTTPNTLNIAFPGVTGAAVLECSPDVAASTGSACHDGEVALPSSVLSAMGVPRELALGAVRLSLGRAFTEPDLDRAVQGLVAGWRAALDRSGGRGA